jgi:hypothetical protein
MGTHVTGTAAKAARLRVKLASGAAGLAIAGAVLAACSAPAAGAAKPAGNQAQPGQYRQAVYPAATSKSISEREQYRLEHRITLPGKTTLSGTPGDNDLGLLRKEHLAR